MACTSSIASYTPKPHAAARVLAFICPVPENREWEKPSHKTREREDWSQEWEDEYSDAFPDIPPPEPKCGLKVYKGYAAMSRTPFFTDSEIIRDRPFLLYLKLYHWARPLGKYRGMIFTSRKELAKAAGLHVSTLNYDLDTLKFMEFIEVVTSVLGRPRGGRGHSRDPGRLVIRIVDYQTAEEAGNDKPPF